MLVRVCEPPCAGESRPVVKRLERALIKLKANGRHLPQSLLGTAIDYALGQWRTLEVYLADGRVEIDNNLVENAIRPTAIGKNYAQLSIMRRCAALRFRLACVGNDIHPRPTGPTRHNHSWSRKHRS